jgi:hypothetical protein
MLLNDLAGSAVCAAAGSLFFGLNLIGEIECTTI